MQHEIKPRSLVDSLLLPVLSQSSYKKHQLLDLHTILVERKPLLSLVHQEFIRKRRRQRWSAIVAITFEQKIFSDIYTIVKIITRSVIEPCFVEADGHEYTQNDYCNPCICTKG